MKTIQLYRNHKITKVLGTYQAQTGRYGIVKSENLKEVKKLIDNSISL